MKRPFHLAWFLSQGYGPKSWRGDWPGSDVGRWMMPDLFVDLARGMERACFDYIIIEDSSNVPYTYKGSHDTYLQYAASAPKLDPAVLAKLRDPRIKASEETIRKSLEGNWRAEHVLALKQRLSLYRSHCELINEHTGNFQIHFRLTGLRIGDLPEKKRGILRLHHNELNKTLGQFSGLSSGLDFGHRMWAG